MERAEGRRLRRALGVSAPSAVEAEFPAPVVIAERGKVLSASAIRMRAVRSALPKGTCGKNYLMRNEFGIDYVTKIIYKICILAHGGASSRDDPEGGAGIRRAGFGMPLIYLVKRP